MSLANLHSLVLNCPKGETKWILTISAPLERVKQFEHGRSIFPYRDFAKQTLVSPDFLASAFGSVGIGIERPELGRVADKKTFLSAMSPFAPKVNIGAVT